MSKKETVVFDIGSSKIAAIVGLIHDKEIDIVNHFLYPSEGIKASLITDFAQAEESIVNTIIAIEKTSKNFIKEAAISICTSRAKSTYVTSKIKIASGTVASQDLQKLINKALSDFSDSEGQVIHYFPVEFILDNNHGIVNPIGMIGNDLSCNLHIVSVDSNVFTNLVHCLNKCQIKVKEVILSGYASALGCVSYHQQETGTLVIDFGARTTSFIVLFEGKMIYCGYVPIGSWYITSDIARAFSISMQAAEKLKLTHGSSKLTRTSHLINLHDIDPNEFKSNQVISSADLSSVIVPRVEEIFTLLKKEYSKLKINDIIAQNIIITGGGSKLPDLAETVADTFGKSVKVSSVEDPNLEGEVDFYTTAYGMLRFISDKQKQDLLINTDHKGLLGKVWGWLKNNV